jgi:hypothetical protein
MAIRTDPERHKEQVRLANAARYKAIRALIAENQERFDALYAEFARPLGIEPKPRGRVNAAQIQSQIAELQARLKSMGVEASA